MHLIQALLIFSLFLPLIARCQDGELKPCGTITKSLVLQRDCSAPMVIARDNITVNLNGYTIQAVPLPGEDSHGGIEIFDRRGVTIKNGTIFGNQYGLLVRRGGKHTFRNLIAKSTVYPGFSALFEDVDDTVVKQVTVYALSGGFSPFFFTGNDSKIVQVSSRGDESRGAGIYGDRLLIANNDFESRLTGIGLGFSGNRSILRGNKITGSAWYGTGLCFQGSHNLISRNTIMGSFLGLFSSCDTGPYHPTEDNTIRNNDITSDSAAFPQALDILARESACTSTWKNNRFETDDEGDGPDAGCIR
jgi:hypothetical protein